MNSVPFPRSAILTVIFSSNRLFNVEAVGESDTTSILLDVREGAPGSGE